MIRRIHPSVLAVAILSFAASVFGATTTPASGGYAVVVSQATRANADWAGVVDALVGKHHATVIVHKGRVAESLPALRRSFPRYVCFVARSTEAGRQFVVDVHRLTRQLDGDPYTDVLWGILTGYRAADALRIAQAPGPLVIRKGGAGTGLNLGLFDEGMWFSEGSAGVYCQKVAGGKPEKKKGPADSTKALVDFLNKGRPDLFLTSGHATEHDWQLGYSYKNGQFRCRDGKLFGRDLAGKEHPIDSPNPKVYLASGNCLIGHIRDGQSMALGWLSSGGANQMVAYTVSTWYGAMGWGTRDRLFDLPGRYSVTEAFYFTNQEIIHKLLKKFPKTANLGFGSFDMRRDRRLLGRYAARLGYRKSSKTMREHLGLLWDRDTVAFYGDPAWEARLVRRGSPLTSTLSHKDDTYTLSIRAASDCTPAKPLATLLPHRVKDVTVQAGSQFQPLIADNFLMLMKSGPFEAGKTYKVVFRAGRI